MQYQSSIDLARRTTIQDTLLSVKSEKATTVAKTENAAAVSAKGSPLQEPSSRKDSSDNEGDDENGAGNNAMVGNKGAGVEECRFNRADGGLGLELGRVANDQRNRLQNRGP